MEPYQYAITWYPNEQQNGVNDSPRILYHGMFVADSQLTAYKKMIDMVSSEQALEAEQIEFMAKPFLDDASCKTKKDISENFMYNFYMDNTYYELRSSTASLEDFIKGTFLNYNNDTRKPGLPKAIMMIDVLALINDDKKL